jgi:hypothetical protein
LSAAARAALTATTLVFDIIATGELALFSDPKQKERRQWTKTA